MSAVSALSSSTMNDAVTSSAGSSELDREAFMLLLVTQFQYQDPLNPMEDKEFIAQLAQFSSLEQMMNLNEGMEGLTQATYNQELINATSYIGKNVDMTGTTVTKSTDLTTGDITISGLRYAIGETATVARVHVYNEANNIVRSYTLPAQAPGTHEFNEWDGTDNNGNVVPDGSYRIIPEFYNSEGDGIMYDAVVDGLVTGVLTDNGITYLSLSDGRTTPLSEVRRVTEPNVVNNTGNSSSGSSGSDTDPEDTEEPENEPSTIEENLQNIATAATDAANKAADAAVKAIDTANEAAVEAAQAVQDAANTVATKNTIF